MARSSVTAKQILYDAKGLLGARDSIKPNPTEGIRYINYSMFTLSNLLDGLYRTFETKAAAITHSIVDTDNDNVRVAHTGDGVVYTSATKTLDTDSATLDDPKHIGGIAALYVTGTTKGYIGIIDSITDSDTCILVTDVVGGDLGNGAASLYVAINPWYRPGLNTGGVAVKRLLTVNDSSLGDFTRINQNEFEDADDNPNLEDSLAFWDWGDAIHIHKGSGLGAHGTLTLYYAADPAAITAITDSIDLEEEHHKALVQDVARQIEHAYPDLGKRQERGDPYGYLRHLYSSATNAFVMKKLGIEVPGRAEGKV